MKNDVTLKMQTIIFEAQSKTEVVQIQKDSTHVQLRMSLQNVQRTPIWNPCVYDTRKWF